MAANELRLFVALYTDADVSRHFAEQLRQRGFDAVSAIDLDNSELSDQEQLEYAISEKRAILTFNIKDFAPLFEEYWHKGREHYGIIVSEQIPLGEVLRRTLRLLNTVTFEEMKNNTKNLGEFADR